MVSFTIWVLLLFFSTNKQDILRKIGKISEALIHFHIMLSNQYCNYKLRNIFQSNSQRKVWLVKDWEAVLQYVGLPKYTLTAISCRYGLLLIISSINILLCLQYCCLLPLELMVLIPLMYRKLCIIMHVFFCFASLH